MAQPARWGRSEDDGGLAEGMELYRLAVEEYRFQTTYNWSRTQYLLGFATLILIAGSAAAQWAGRSAALVFLLGAIAAAASPLVIRTQHGYYRATRDRVRRIEDDLDIPARWRQDTTSTMGGRPQVVKVQQVVFGLFGTLLVANAVGAVVVLVR